MGKFVFIMITCKDRLSTSGNFKNDTDVFCFFFSKGAKNVLLWKFLLEELNKPNGNNVQWVDEREGLFRFVDTTEVSKLWGMKKNKEDEKE